MAYDTLKEDRYTFLSFFCQKKDCALTGNKFFPLRMVCFKKGYRIYINHLLLLQLTGLSVHKVAHHIWIFYVTTDSTTSLDDALTSTKDTDSPFCLLLKKKVNIRVGPKSTLDIPVCFAPTEMTLYEALCTVVVRKEGGEKWQYSPADSDG